MKEGVACYQDYLRGLLDLTDNLAGTTIVPPPQVVRIDGDDPYLVVAADKGTATFSDYANAISKEYGHWLGDAFASGGSAGYDHKGMGITARGAWESVKRFFRETGHRHPDARRSPWSASATCRATCSATACCCRGTSGWSPRSTTGMCSSTRNPDPVTSFAERQRLFKLPRSSWADYDAKLISDGGGVWARSEKSIPISPQTRAALGIEAERLTPTELLSAILKAPVDLLYNGGIGTYVKASTRDPRRRRRPRQRRAARRRPRAALQGRGRRRQPRLHPARAHRGGARRRAHQHRRDRQLGRASTPRTTRSTSRSCSASRSADGEMTEKQRNALLAQMTDDVAMLVLRDNYFQTQALSVGARLRSELPRPGGALHPLPREDRAT